MKTSQDARIVRGIFRRVSWTLTKGDGKARKSLLGLLENKLTDLGWSSGDIFGIQMAVEESVSNAYSHGNKNGDLGNVEIKWKVTARRCLNKALT